MYGMLILNKATKKSSFRIERIITFLDPFKDTQNGGWQVIQSLYAIGSGGLFGVGLGNSTQKYLYLPEALEKGVCDKVLEDIDELL